MTAANYSSVDIQYNLSQWVTKMLSISPSSPSRLSAMRVRSIAPPLLALQTPRVDNIL